MAEPVDDGAPGERPAAAGLVFQLSELFSGHFGVTFVVERLRAAAVGEFASRAEEEDDRTCAGRGDVGEDGGGINRRMRKRNHGDSKFWIFDFRFWISRR